MVEPTGSARKLELDRFCDAMLHIREDIRLIEHGKMDKDNNNPLKNAPHTMQEVIGEKWDHPYSRDMAAYPVARDIVPPQQVLAHHPSHRRRLRRLQPRHHAAEEGAHRGLAVGRLEKWPRDTRLGVVRPLRRTLYGNVEGGEGRSGERVRDVSTG
jgi:hypothetical protein